MAPSPDPRHGPRCVLPAGGFSGPGTALGTAGGQEWGAISCAPYPHPGLLDWVDRHWTTSTGFQSDHSSRSGGRKPPDFRLLTGDRRPTKGLLEEGEFVRELMLSPTFPRAAWPWVAGQQ